MSKKKQRKQRRRTEWQKVVITSRRRMMKMELVVLFFLLVFATTSCAALPVTNGLVLHLDANSISGVSDGNPISVWMDQSGVGNNATQPTAGIQPLYIASEAAFLNNPVVRFDGTNDWMELPSTTVTVGSFTAFVVAKYDHINSNQYITAGQDGGGNDRIRFALDTSSSPVFEYRAGSSGWKNVTAPADLEAHVFEMTSTVEGFLDGTSLGTASNTSNENPTAFNLGSYNRGQKDFFDGDLAELVIFNRILTNDERNEVGLYLGAKYGIQTAYEGAVPKVHTPAPPNGSHNISLDAVLNWQAPGEVTNPEYNVYFGTAETFPILVSERQTATTFDPYGPDPMQAKEVYYWRVDINEVSEGPVWSFTTHPEPMTSLDGDMNEDGIVDIYDLSIFATRWLDLTYDPVDIDGSGRVDFKNHSYLSSSWLKEGPLPPSYVVSRYSQGDFKIAYNGEISSIYVDSSDYEVCQIAADCLAEDIERVCGTKPAVVHITAGLSGHVIFIGTLGNSAVIDTLVSSEKVNVSDITGQWETFALEVVDDPIASVDRGLVIIGSDRRGTAFGVFDLSENMGVSPWFWWADVPVRYREQIIVRDGRYKQGPPSVKYRGIFINDEDWGLHPWARNTYAPEDGYIGPKTYRKVFELLLRLKANHIWPAMHECTQAFNAFTENKLIADQYAIVMGSSHCEQMLRNNVWEWYRWTPSGGGPRGDWDWCTNSANIAEYWEDRVEVNGSYENIYTTGMRGIHDSGMPCSGASSWEKMQKMQNEIFPAQRQMLADWVNPDPSTVPQIFCPYKEVLDLYELGLQVPDDITIAWADDNHGYIRRLSNPTEQSRSGRSGVYYHISYWGSPHDYLWLCSTPPGLIWEEMKKAYDYTADRVWIINVGDIKPAEICMEFALRMAWDINQWDQTNLPSYLEQWAWREFGPEYKEQIAEIMVDYYRLGLTRKPEHMTSGGAEFTLIHYGDEAQKRIDAYQTLVDKADAIYQSLPDIFQDAFFQLVLYPVRGASLMNKKILYAKKSRDYATQGRVSANEYAAMAQSAYDQIITETDFYNDSVANGKWKYMMSWNPRGLAVFGEPDTSTVSPQSGSSMGVILEGQTSEVSENSANDLPDFDVYTKNTHFIDIFNKGNTAFNWTAIPSAPWIQLDSSTGNVTYQKRIWVSINWDQVPLGESNETIEITGAGSNVTVELKAVNPSSPRPYEIDGFVQSNGYVSMEAEHFTNKIARSGASWEKISSLGRTGDTMTILPTTTQSRDQISDILANSPYLEYQIYLWDTGYQEVTVYCIPTHAITSERGLRYAVAFDSQTPQIVEYDTSAGSSQWSTNVLQGAAISKSGHTLSGAGQHTLKIWMVDPGVVLDKIVVGYADASHLGPPETLIR